MIDIRRIEKLLARYGDHFISRIFTTGEQNCSERRKNSAASYAKRFAAKEACVKALGTGIAEGIGWCDLAVSNLGSGKPVMNLTGNALIRLNSLLPKQHHAVIHLSMTDDYPWAQAFIVIEAVLSKHELQGSFIS